LKKHILSEHWPSNFVEVAEIDRLRLFASGRELEDPRSLSDLSVVASQAGFAPVHVTVVTKSAKQAGAQSNLQQSKASTGCQCCVM
jgi:hypothetical protein